MSAPEDTRDVIKVGSRKSEVRQCNWVIYFASTCCVINFLHDF